MSKLTRTEQIIAEKTVCVLLVRGEGEDGEKLYAYVAVRADKLEPFIEAQKAGVFYPEDFGIVIESGEGEPSDEVKAKMTKEYGFNHDSMLNIPSSGDAHKLTSALTSHAAKISSGTNEE